MRHGESETTRKAAAESLLDRGYGRPMQQVSGEDGGAIVINIQKRTGD